MTKTQGKTSARQAIVVLGMHRSGTSALTGALERLGCAMPKQVLPPQPDNPKGFFESRVAAKLSDEILKAAGSHWSDWKPVRDWMGDAGVATFVDRAAQVLRDEFGAAPVIALKDPRLCLTFPVWRAALRQEGIAPLITLIHRHPSEVAQSLAERNGLAPAKGMLLWLRYQLEAELATRGLKRVFTSFDRIMRDGLAELSRIGEMLGVAYPHSPEEKRGALEELLMPGMRHFDVSTGGAGSGPELADWMRDSLSVLDGWAQGGETPGERRVLDRVRKQFDAAVPAFHGAIEIGAPGSSVAGGSAKIVALEGKLAGLRKDSAEAATALQARLDLAEGEAVRIAEKLAQTQTEAAQMAEKADRRVAALEMELQERSAALEAAETTARGLQDTRQRLNKTLAAARENLRHLQDDLTRRDRQLNEMQSRLDHTLVEAELVQVAKETVRAQADALSLALESTRGKLGQAETKLAKDAAEIEKLKAMLGFADARLAALRGSSSWKITAPMRKVSTLLRGARKGED
jgi:hypothetical protein